MVNMTRIWVLVEADVIVTSGCSQAVGWLCHGFYSTNRLTIEGIWSYTCTAMNKNKQKLIA